jgi:hypothetical protein
LRKILTSRSQSIAPNVSFDTVAREWRCKWDGTDESKASLQAAQSLIEAHLAAVKAVDGFVSAQRFVCGGCYDFKINIGIEASKYGAWESAGHAPETEFLAALRAIAGITEVETQTITVKTL